MVGNTSKETHFRFAHSLSEALKIEYTDPYSRLVITSKAFHSKMQPARHRMIYALLSEEMAREGGIHALQLRTLTPEEEERQQKKKEEAEAAKAAAKADAN